MRRPSQRQHQMDAKTRKRLKQIAHHLDPIIAIGDQGLTDSVAAEVERALTDHELIKIKIHNPDRDARAQLGKQLAESTDATIVQRIGKVIVLFRPNPEPKPGLSNLARFGMRATARA